MEYPIKVDVIFDGSEPKHPVLLSEPVSIGYKRYTLAEIEAMKLKLRDDSMRVIFPEIYEGKA